MENLRDKKIAIIGSGIAGLGFAYIAQQNNLDITLFEKNDYFGGHSNTIDINLNGKEIAVDTGFLVHNKITYPNLIQLLDQLKVEIVDTDMSLSIKVEDSNFEWGGTNLNTVFGQRRNLFNPYFYRFLLQILKFNKQAEEYLNWAKEDPNRTLGDLLSHYGYSSEIKDWYIIPMAAAIWSTPANKILDFPAHTFLTFSLNHHLLQVNGRPTWRTIKNGSRNYVRKIANLIKNKHLKTTVSSIEFKDGKNYLTTNRGVEVFDLVIFASHADESLKILNNANVTQLNVLSNFKFEKNIAYVHSDVSFLPERKKLWSAWNYVNSQKESSVTVNYLINKLQPLETDLPIIVTLNPHRPVSPEKTYRVIEYHHPLFDVNAIHAQGTLDSIQGINQCYFIGAWTGYGFHEDGLKSAVKLAKTLNLKIPWHEVL